MEPFVTVVVPAFNEQDNLELCVNAVRQQLDIQSADYEILIINDGSQDQTGIIGDKLAAVNERIRIVHHPVKRGIGSGFLTGVKNAKGEWLILIPADLPMEPKELNKYLAHASGNHIVVGYSTARDDYSKWRRLISKTNIICIRFLFKMRFQQFFYCSMYRIDTLRQMDIEYFRSAFFLAEILIKASASGSKMIEVEINYKPRVKGRAVGANIPFVLHTVRDMLQFWLKGGCTKNTFIPRGYSVIIK